MFFVLLFALLSLTSHLIPSDAVVYVSKAGSDSNDGSSWQTAYLSVGAALRTSDNTINIGEGSFTVPNTLINRTLTVYGRGSQLTFLSGSGFKVTYLGASVPLVRIVDVAWKAQILQIGYAPNNTALAFENIEVVGCAILNGNGLFQSDGGSLTFDNVSIRGTNPNGEASVIYAPFGDIIIRNSVFYKNPNIAVINAKFFTNGTVYSDNRGFLNARGSANMTIYYSEFYSNYYDPTINTFICQTGAVFNDILGNVFCGANSNRFNCPGYNIPPLVHHDGCGRCGVTTNLDKDCNGICFGRTPAANCTERKTIFAAPNGNNSNDGTTFWKPVPIQTAVSRASYQDTVIAMPGNYSFPKLGIPFGFQGKSITIKSYLDDPTTVVLKGLVDLVTPLLNVSQGESFDSVLQSVTLFGGSPHVYAIADSGVTLMNCILESGYAYKAGAVIVGNDGGVIIKNSIIKSNYGSTPGGGGAMWFESDNNHWSYGSVTGSRFFYNWADSYGTVRILTNSWVYIGQSWFDSNRATAGAAEISVDSPTSTVQVEVLSIRDTNSQGIPKGISCPSTDPLLKVTANQLYICPNNVTNFSNCSSKVNLGPLRSYSACGGCGIYVGRKDCLDQCWGYATNDLYGTCCNNTAKDCNNICYGSGGYDIQWTCCRNKSAIDCSGLCNGTAKLDCFGVCQGDGLTDNLGVCCHDYEIMGCDFNCRSNKTLDALNVCCSPNEKDCAGLCYGNSTLDSQGTCCYSNEITGCDSVCRSNATVDIDGSCCIPEVKDCGGFCYGNRTDGPGGCCFDIRRDCDGLCNGPARIDCDGNCTIPTGNETSCCTTVTDCFGNCEGEGIVDPNGVCCYSEEMDCMNYCRPEQGPAIHVEDHAGTCCKPATFDCNSTCSGTWKTDIDGACCEPPFDCNGRCGGTEARDATGHCCPRLSLDCAMQCNGTHVKDPVDGSCCMTSDLDCKGRCFGSNFSCRETIQLSQSAAGSVLTWMMALFLGALLLSL